MVESEIDVDLSKEGNMWYKQWIYSKDIIVDYNGKKLDLELRIEGENDVYSWGLYKEDVEYKNDEIIKYINDYMFKTLFEIVSVKYGV